MVCPSPPRRLAAVAAGMLFVGAALSPAGTAGAASTPAAAASPTAKATAKAATPTAAPTREAAPIREAAPTHEGVPTREAIPTPPAAQTPPASRSAQQMAAATPVAQATPAAVSTPAAVATPSAGTPTPKPGSPTVTPPPTHTPTPTASATPSPTATPAPPPPTATPVVVPTLGQATGAARGWMEGSLMVLDVPIRSQFDGSEYQAANCGPSSLGMVLEAFGVQVPTSQLRNLANRLQGTYDRDAGIALQYLGDIAAQTGLRPLGLRDGAQFHRWSVDEVRDQVRRGHPVITLVRMRELPDYAGSRADTDHYVVVVGLDGEQLLVNDPAQPGDKGFRRPLTPAQLERAWDASSIPRQALAIGAPAGMAEVAFPAPGAGAGPGAAVDGSAEQQDAPQYPSPSMTLPQQALQAGGAAGAPQQVTSAGQPQVVVIITPVIYVNVNIPPNAFPAQPTAPTPSPAPTRDRWARPVDPSAPSAAGLESPAMPIAQAPAAGSTPVAYARPPASPGGPLSLVLGASAAVPAEEELRWFARLGMLSLGAVVLRWALR